MLKSYEGIYKDGKIELLGDQPECLEARVIVTFLPATNLVDLQARGISRAQAADL